jgi:hypothetical protein
MVPSVGPQVRELSHEAQRAIGDLRHNATVRRHDDRYHISEKIQAQLRGLPSRLGQAAAPLRDVTVGVFGFASNLVAVMSIAFLLILHGGRYAGAVVSLLPPARADRWRRVAPRIYQAVSAYVVGNLEISVIAGAGAWITMAVLGVPFAVPLAIVVGFFDLVVGRLAVEVDAASSISTALAREPERNRKASRVTGPDWPDRDDGLIRLGSGTIAMRVYGARAAGTNVPAHRCDADATQRTTDRTARR